MDDLTGEFISETTDSLAVLDAELMKLEHTPGDKAVLGNIYRLVHTIKGTCGFLGLPRLEAVAASGERLLVTIRDDRGDVSPSALLLLLEMLGRIKGLIAYLAEHGDEPEGDDNALTQQLDQFSPQVKEKTGAQVVAAVLMPEKKETPVATPAEPAPPSPAPVQPSTPAVQAKAEPAPISPKAKQEAIRHGLDTQVAPDGLRERVMQLTAELVNVRNTLAEHIRHREEPELRELLRRMSAVATGLRKEASAGGANFSTPIAPVLMVEAGGLKFALPQEAIVELLRIDGASEYASTAHVMRLRGKVLPLLPLRTALELSPMASGKDYVAVLRFGDVEFGIVVDRIYDLEELVLTKISGVLANIGLYRGTSMLGDGSVVLMLEPEGLARVLGVALQKREALHG